jgi:hypothetical protein
MCHSNVAFRAAKVTLLFARARPDTAALEQAGRELAGLLAKTQSSSVLFFGE